MTTASRADLQSLLQPFHQEHLLQFWDSLSPAQQVDLKQQIENIDLELIQRLTNAGAESQFQMDGLADCESPPAIRLNDPGNRFSADEALEAGEAAIRAGRVAVLLVAGGQGSRLGFPHPKGMLPIGPVSHRTLFQIHADRLLALSRRYGVTIPLLLMTSPATHEETVDYLDETGYLCLPREQVFVFCQGTMPAVDVRSGHVLLEGVGRLFASPDGHGGTIAALAKEGLFEALRVRGIDQLFYFQVDNPQVAVADPIFVGYHLLADSEMTTQVVPKRDPFEKVGNLVQHEGTLRIVEYSDLPSSVATLRNDDGTLKVWAGNIAVHMFDVEFLEDMSCREDALPFHRALKKVPYLDGHGNIVSTANPNAIKFERFIFDILPHVRNGLVVEVDPAEAFSPVKNAAGSATDTQETAQQCMLTQHRRWLESAGAVLADDCRVEINPLFAFDANELRTKLTRGTRINVDTYFQ